MLPCDGEPSPKSKNLFFIYDKLSTRFELSDAKESSRCQNKERHCEQSSKELAKVAKLDCNNVKSKRGITDVSKTEKVEKSFQSESNWCEARSQSAEPSVKRYVNTVHATSEQTVNTDDTKEDETRASRTSLVKIHVENCSQSIDSVSSTLCRTLQTSADSKDRQCKTNASLDSQVNYNSIESAVVSAECAKSSKTGHCNAKASIVQKMMKSRKRNVNSADATTKSADTKKKYLWSSRSQPVPPNKTCFEKSDSNCSAEKTTKNKKPACSPFKKLSRSSLTIDPDKITINLSKYSPCASRLAASSKILSSNSIAGPESPLRIVRARSPSQGDVQVERISKPLEKMTIQASLSLNIQQFQKPSAAPRSKSVGDSCVTSPTSEATTVSYSPTGTEILSLDEVGSHASANEVSKSHHPPQVEENSQVNEHFGKPGGKAALETKC